MKKVILSFALIVGALFSQAQTVWKIDAGHSSVNFKIDHLGIAWVSGSFGTFSGSVKAEKEDFSDMTVDIEIDASSVNTGVEGRDKHLMSDDFFKAEKYPKMTFKSTKVVKAEGGKLSVTGDFTMLDKTLPITLDAEFRGVVTDPRGNVKAGFVVKGIVDRYAYGIEYNAPLESGGFILGQNVHLYSFIELTKSK